MAPSKKRAEVVGSPTKRVTRSGNRRVTRSETRKQGSNSALLVSAEFTKQQKKTKTKAKTSKKTKLAAASKEKTPQSEEASTDIAQVGKKTEHAKQAADDSGLKLIVIERCTQCSSFKRTATAVKEGLETAVPGIKVVINPEKPRRGCLEVREDGGQIFLSLLDMKRPFTAMKKLDMAKVVSDIVKKIKY